MKPPLLSCLGALFALGPASTYAGPYSAAHNDPANVSDAPVPGFTGPHGAGKARLLSGFDDDNQPEYAHPDNFVNPLFFGWANGNSDYSTPESVTDARFANPAKAYGPVTGDNFDVVSLGDMTAAQITAGTAPGRITLTFPQPIFNKNGADFVVFENGYIATSNQGGAGIGGIFAELAYVEVSDGGVNFVRFPSTSLTAAATGSYGTINATEVTGLAGKHANASGDSWGTPFDLAAVGLSRITHIRLVDIPGNGAFTDSSGRPVYDAWKTSSSGGFDLEAVGVISTNMTYASWPSLASLPSGESGTDADPDHDGMTNLVEYATGGVPWIADSVEATGRIQISGGQTMFSFIRDERLTDVLYEVQSSPDLAAESWETIASGASGALITATAGHTPVIMESSASAIASVGVLRCVTVSEAVSTRRFYRLKISLITPP